MPHIPRFARLFLVVLAVVAIPTLWLLYPTAEGDNQVGLDKGGIDSEHWSPPKEPALEDKPNRVGEQLWLDEDEDVAKGESESESESGSSSVSGSESESSGSSSSSSPFVVDQDLLSGDVIMPFLGNATAKAELGRATWRFLHLVTLRYPDEPTPEQRQTLKSFFYLFSRLYPCGECAQHFQKMLKTNPPQTSSRKAASLWLCDVHNIVNARLHKPEFDCLTLDSTYDCGCGNETTTAGAGTAAETGKRTAEISASGAGA